MKNELLQKLADSVPAGMGIYRVYQDGRLEMVYLNEGYYLMLGTTRKKRQQFFGFSVFDAVHAEDRPIVMREVMACIRENRPVDTELRVLTDEGAYKWFSIRASIMERTADSALLYCAYSDIDELKRAKLLLEQERARRIESDALLQSIMNNLPGAVVSFEAKNDLLYITYISEGCQKITGFTARETMERLGQDAMADVHPDDRAECHRQAMNALKTGAPFNSIQRVKTKNGTYAWVSLTLSPDVRDDCIRYYGIYLDVSDEQESRLMLDQLVSCLPGGVAVFKFGGQADQIETLYYSDGLRKISQSSPQELANHLSGSVLTNCVYEDDLPNVYRIVQNALDTGASFGTTYRLKCADGSLVWTQVYGSKLRDESDGQVYYMIFTKPTQETYLYQSIVEDAATAVLVVDMEYRKIVYANTAWRTFCQIPPSMQVIGEELTAILPSQDIMITKEFMLSLPEDSYKELHEVNAHGRHLRIFAKRLQWNGRAAYICHATDETEVQASREKLQGLIDMVPGGIAIYDIGQDSVELSYINNAYAQMLGDMDKRRTEFLGPNTISAVHPEDRHIIHETAQKLRSGSDLVDIQFRIPDAQGRYLWVRMTGVVVKRDGEHIQMYASYSNCNEIVKAQQELLSSRVMLNEALKIARVMVWKYDRRQHAITDSGTLGLAYHLPKRIEGMPQALLDAAFLAKESEASFRELFTRLETELQAEVTVKALAVDGKEYRMFKLIYTTVLDDKGCYLETIGTSIDVTEQIEREKNYEEQLHLKDLMASNAIAVAHLNLTRNLVSAVDAKTECSRAILSSSVADEMLAALVRAVPEYQRSNLELINGCDRLLRLFSHGRTHFETHHQLADDPAWYESRFDLLENPYTGDVEAIAILNDVTYEVRAEQVVSVLMQVDYESVLTLDAESGAPSPFVHNALAEDMVGVIKEQQAAGNNVEGVARYLEKYCVNSDKERVIRETSLPYVKQMLEKQPIHTSVYTLELDGKRIHKRAIFAYLDDSRRMLLCAIQDITETYRQEEAQRRQLAAALLEAKEANRKKTDFFSQMSHDMRTPMNGILGLTELAEEENDPKQLKADISKIKASGEYLLSLINDTLDFQRIESGKMTIEPAVIQGERFLDSIVDMVKPTADLKHITFRVLNNGADTSRYVRIDAVRTKQVIVNLLSNALKFTPRDGVVSLSFLCTARTETSSHLVIRVQDTGIGMSKEFLQNGIFQPFSQEYNAVTAQYAGSGLGLSIVHRLVGLMGGSIAVESEKGVGTTFTIEMDFELVKENEVLQAVSDDESLRRDAMNRLNGRNVLLVEDHPLNAEIAQRLLQKAGCRVVWTSDGQKGLDAFQASAPNEFDAILMDIRMPVMDGVEAARRIRALPRPDAACVPIIAMTANAYDEDVQTALGAGMNAHLAKPVDPTTLYKQLATCIGDRHLRCTHGNEHVVQEGFRNE